MELAIYKWIKGPVISDKAFRLNKDKNQLMLKVHPSVTKPMIKEALEKLFKVKTKSVRTIMRKKRRAKGVGRRFGTPSITKIKIAYVTLAEGYSLNLFEQSKVSLAESPAKEQSK